MSTSKSTIAKGAVLTALEDSGAVMPLGSLSGDMQDLVIQGAQGQDPNDVNASRRDLFIAVYDRSTSMAGLAQSVIEGQNIMIDGMADSKEAKQFAASQYLFAERGQEQLLHSFVPLADVVRFNPNVYKATGWSTAVRDAMMAALLAGKAYSQLLIDNGTPTKVTLVCFTDGQDNDSSVTAAALKTEITAALKSERWNVAFVGFADNKTDEKLFIDEAKSWGLNDGSIKAVPKDKKEARRMFELTSQSQVRASQGKVQTGPNTGFFV